MRSGTAALVAIATAGFVAADAQAGRERRACPDRGKPSLHGKALGVPDHACKPRAKIRMSGTAYTFNTRNGIANAEIYVDELPELFAVTDENGAWELEVPVGRNVTPYIVAEDHHTIYLQTFHTGTADIEQVNFQTPQESIYNLLYLLIQSYIGAPPFEQGCVIVSTVSDPAVVGMSFDEFIHFAPHGVAGAEAYGVPALPDPIYFNDNVFPDLNQELTSGDGGVLFANVPIGVYDVFATHPDYEFASFTATCEQDRVINANPPWGLHGIP